MKKRRTSFEQISVEAVKKLTKEMDTVDPAQNAMVETAEKKSRPHAIRTTAPVSNGNKPDKR